VEAILDVYVRGVEIKQILDPDVIMMHLLQKKNSWRNACVGLHRENHMFHTKPW